MDLRSKNKGQFSKSGSSCGSVRITWNRANGVDLYADRRNEALLRMGETGLQSQLEAVCNGENVDKAMLSWLL